MTKVVKGEVKETTEADLEIDVDREVVVFSRETVINRP